MENTVQLSNTETFAYLEVIKGRGDVSAIVTASEYSPLPALTQESEMRTVFQQASDSRPVAYFSEAPWYIITLPNGRNWAGYHFTHLRIFRLNGEIED